MLNKILYIVIDVDDSALRLLPESLQNLIIKDVPGENVGMVVRYLKEARLLL